MALEKKAFQPAAVLLRIRWLPADKQVLCSEAVEEAV